MSESALTRDDLEALVTCAGELTAEIRLEEVLPRILRRAADLTGSADGSVFLHDTRRDGLYFAAATGDQADYVLKRWGEHAAERIPRAGSIAGKVFNSGQSTIVQRVAEAPAHFKLVDQQTGTQTESLLTVPLACGEDRLGVVQLRNAGGRTYGERERVLLERFANLAAIAIRNAQLFDRLIAHMGLLVSKGPDHSVMSLVEQLRAPARSERLTVVFADMRGFTQLCQLASSAEQVQALLSELIGTMAREVIDAQGIVNKFLGDGVLALFRGDDHATRAVRCAFRIVEAVGALKQRWLEETNFNLDFMDVGVGIVTDTVILGSIGIEGGVRDFTAIGTPVVLAAAFQNIARGGRRIMVDRMTYHAVRDIVEAEQPPRQFELKKPDQKSGRVFDQYHLTALKREAASASASAAPAPAAAAKAAPARSDAVFVSYSHRDSEWLERLHQHLKPFLRAGALDVWDDTKLAAGATWRDEIERALERASVAVLLVSPNFLASDFIADRELAPILERARVRGVTILWIAVSASAFDETDIRHYQAANDPARPLDSIPPAAQNQALVDICKKIKQAVTGRPVELRTEN